MVDASSSSVLETPVPELTPDDTAAATDFYEKIKKEQNSISDFKIIHGIDCD